MMYPRLLLYRHSPNDFLRSPGVTVSVEYQGMEYPSENMMTMEVHRAGRTSIIIEGENEYVQPYLIAVQALMEIAVQALTEEEVKS